LEIDFASRRLERCFREHRAAVRAFGDEVARRYIQRINLMKAARGLDELTRLPALRCHPLKGQRAGQYAIDLTGFYRLIFTLHGESLTIARIEEVSKHYGD
jgi:proteic killer suppression protein